MGDVTAVITEVTVSVLPENDLERSYWGVKVVWRAPGEYAVEHHGDVLDRDGDWVYEPIPSSRTDKFRRRTRFDYLTAYRLACEHAPRVRVNGMNAEELLQWREAKADA